MICASELTVTWQRSSRSQNGADNCVEVACLSDATAVRDSKEPDGPALVFGAGAFSAFLDDIKAGRFRG
ncbi:DUF397 domain-containing protein [Saccharopolyspora sp. ASAGF58]|uniref:DUF397 domain-containing protein n=1 Tax=Saccharopolyspora sp. ASAGF58 TaxID=2719023 RepID=UPI00143FD1DB|nr:DUF397 domain-containing protein [Saccharopolyspora sp. ASAGF58]QIZ34918.1 DUF397 domain-containing protein [Saccharopolyspora sp. ASAGF58]